MEKEWFALIVQEFLNEENGQLLFIKITHILKFIFIGLFRAANTDEISYVIAEDSDEIETSAEYFEFFGLILAKAIFDEIPLNLCLNRLMFKLFMDPEAEIVLEDIKCFDTSVYNSLKYLLDTDIDEDEYLEFYFTHEYNDEMHPLVPDGENIKVTNENKENYVLLKVEFMVKNFIGDQIEAIRSGFEILIPFELIKDFDEKEIEYLICGENEISISDWKQNTVYTGSYNTNHYIILWFWKFLEELDQDSLRVLLQFVTGMSKLPAGGFGSLSKNRGNRQFFTIRSVEYFEDAPYPKAYT